MRAGHFSLLIRHLLTTVTISRECVIHNCSSSALCLLILVSLMTVSSPLCLSHHCLYPIMSDSPLCVLTTVSPHCLRLTTVSPHYCVWLTTVSSPLCLTHQCVSSHSTGAWSSGQNNLTHAYISDQKGRGKLGNLYLNSPNYPNREPSLRLERPWCTAVCTGPRLFWKGSQQLSVSHSPPRPWTEKAIAHGTFPILSVIRWFVFRKFLQQEKHMVNHLWDSILQSSLAREKYFFLWFKLLVGKSNLIYSNLFT